MPWWNEFYVFISHVGDNKICENYNESVTRKPNKIFKRRIRGAHEENGVSESAMVNAGGANNWKSNKKHTPIYTCIDKFIWEH